MGAWGVWLGDTDWGVCISRDIHGLQLVNTIKYIKCKEKYIKITLTLENNYKLCAYFYKTIIKHVIEKLIRNGL